MRFSYDVGALYYFYPGSGIAGTNKIDNTELYGAGDWGPFTLKYSYAVTRLLRLRGQQAAPTTSTATVTSAEQRSSR